MTTTTAPGYVTTNAAPVVLDGKVFTVEVQTMDSGSQTTWLYGQRGGVYFLREFLGEDTGKREVISWKSGAPLRDRCQRPVRVLLVGDVIEQVSR